MQNAAKSGPVTLTEKAAQMIKETQLKEGETNLGIRIGVIGGGCSGLSYLLDFCDNAEADDHVSESHGVTLYVDPFSASHLTGTIIDYIETPQGPGFKFNNPNIKPSSCQGCRSSCPSAS